MQAGKSFSSRRKAPSGQPPTKKMRVSLVNPNPGLTSKTSKLENKNIDVAAPAVPIVFGQTTATLALLNGCAQGTTAITHVGRSIMMKSLTWKFSGHLAPTTTGASPVRLLIIYDKQPNGVACTAAQVLSADILAAPMNLDNSHRFTILADHEISCIGTAGPQAFFAKGYRKIGLPAEFGSAAADITAITTGSVYAFFWQDGGLLVALPSCIFTSRIRFEDA